MNTYYSNIIELQSKIKGFKIIESPTLILVILPIDVIDPHKFYNNLIAFEKSTGKYAWTMEYYEDKREASANVKYSSLGPIIDVFVKAEYLVCFKAHGWKVAVDIKNGKVLRDVNLNFPGRPW